MPDVWRVRGAPAFSALARPSEHDGFRRRSGPVTIAWVPQRTRTLSALGVGQDLTENAGEAHSKRESSEIDAPAVAFAIGRRVGPAVVRNRLRRCIRAEMSQLARRNQLRSGCYLVALRPEAAATDSKSLRAHVRTALEVESLTSGVTG